LEAILILDAVRPKIRNMGGYVPGEQPQPGMRIVKLNTNENPYAPPPAVIEAIKEQLHSDLRLYPEPTSKPVREAAARAYKLHPDQVVVGNGSDDLLTMILRTFVDPGEVVTAPSPTYSLYETLTDIQGGQFQACSWGENGTLPIAELVAKRAKVTFVVRPNAPTGHAVPLEDVVELCSQSSGLVVLDEAYGDFCPDNGLAILDQCPNLMITRSFSKSLALAGLRLGLGFCSREIATELHKVRDSYNVDRIAQAAAVAALDNLEAYDDIINKILKEREALRDALEQRGFKVHPSHANFVLCDVPKTGPSAADWLSLLKADGILVRYFGKKDARMTHQLRISVGTPEETQSLLDSIDRHHQS
jgi:histidinol-phosphate aminotransferase